MKKILNFRPLLFCALSLLFGLDLYGSIRFSEWEPAFLFFFGVLLLLALPPFGKKRLLSLLLIVPLFAGMGAGLMHLALARYREGLPTGEYTVTATVLSVSERQGYSIAVLDDLFFDGEGTEGKCRAILPADCAVPGDLIVFEGTPEKSDPFERSAYARNDFASDIRYTVSVRELIASAESADPFLRLNGKLYEMLGGNMDRDEASLAYALLSGSSGVIEEGLKETVRKGGIAHIFAVSGLHIGVLFGAAMLLFRKLGRFAWIPSWLLAFGYCAFCGFTVSSLRAALMCGVFGASRAFGRKADGLETLAFAAVVVLLLFPAQWYAAGFRLSFGACLGLSLFSGSFSRAFRRLHLPRAVAGALAPTLAAQLTTAPILLSSFGYLSVWSTLLNLLLVPLVPVFFLCTLLSAALALLLPFAAGVLLALPEGLFALLILVLSFSDWTLVLSGFVLGAGGVLFLFFCGFLSPRMQMRRPVRAAAAVLGCALFALVLTLNNFVFAGCRLTVYEEGEGAALLVETRTEHVLVIGGDISLDECEDFLSRTCGGTLTAVVALEEDLLNTAVFLDAEEVRLADPVESGLHETRLKFGEAFSYGELSFRFTREGMWLLAEDVAVEVDFSRSEGNADFFVGKGSGGLKFLLEDGIIKKL